MPQAYNQSRALWAITRASFKAIFAQPTAIVFSLLFPIIFIMIFGAFGNGGGVNYEIAVDSGSDTANSDFYTRLKHAQDISVDVLSDSTMKERLKNGNLTAILHIQQTTDSINNPLYIVTTQYSASNKDIRGFLDKLDYFRMSYEEKVPGNLKRHYVKMEKPVAIFTAGNKRSAIDFVLPGQLGFSILFSTLFGIAFTFYVLREQLVLKRFYASPVRKINILLGVGMSRLFFQLTNVIVLTVIGHYFFGFTLLHGFITFLDIVLMTIIMLFLLMGVGLIFGSIAKTDSSIPLLINLFGFPQMLLAGTFFSIHVFPPWLQSICRVLPLTQYNDAVRKISFEGQHVYQQWKEIGILGIWIAVTYIILARVMKWE
jgi:ABC-2 type transport system permease protein